MTTSMGMFDYIMKETKKILESLEKNNNELVDEYKKGYEIIKENIGNDIIPIGESSKTPELLLQAHYEKDKILSGMEINAIIELENNIARLGKYTDYLNIANESNITNDSLIGNFLLSKPTVEMVSFDKKIETLKDLAGIVNVKNSKINVESESPTKVLITVDKKVVSLPFKDIYKPNILYIYFKDRYVIPYVKLLLALDIKDSKEEPILTLNLTLRNHPALKDIVVTLL